MQGQVSDPERAREIMAGLPADRMAEFRPDLLGSVMIGHDDGRWTQVLYFTSEAVAREGERKQPPPELRDAMEEMMKLAVAEPTFLDLKQPVLHSPS